MPLPAPLALCVGGVFCCSLLALHLLWLAGIYRRPGPTVRGGHANFFTLLVGLGGFLFVGVRLAGPAGQALFAPTRTVAWADGWHTFDQAYRTQLVTAAVFSAGLVTAVAVASWNRRDTLEAHHIDPVAVEQVVADATSAVGLADTAAVTATVRPQVGHATVRVRRLDPVIAAELLAQLRTRLKSAPPSDGSVGAWYTATAGGLLGCTVALFLAFFRYARMI